jgi:23S rRNA pseudouridine1911/1915/1917 synthase
VDRESRRFIAETSHSGRTILDALRKFMPGSSWSDVRKLLAARRVLVSGALCLDEARRLASGEVIEVSALTQARPPAGADVRLVWLDADLVVVDKPAGMTTLRHRAERDWSIQKKSLQPALDDVLPGLIAGREGLDEKLASHVFSVHRIDRETSGLLVFARNVAARDSLICQFHSHSVDRTYLAVVQGDLAAQTFESHLVEDRGDGRRGSTSQPGTGKRAVTHVRPVEQLKGWTLLECRLETGRTHQIRIHLSEAGHPVYGDTKYGPLETSHNAPPIRRMALHATTLGFDQPRDGRRLQFESPPPRDFEQIVAALRRMEE